MKPALTRICPLCSGPMAWCGDQPMDVGTEDEVLTHACHEIVCVACDYNVVIHGIPESPPQDDDEENGFARYLQRVADKWNGA
jgi:hypothetical protein